MNISTHSSKQNLNLLTTVSGFIKKSKQTQPKQTKSNKQTNKKRL